MAKWEHVPYCAECPVAAVCMGCDDTRMGCYIRDGHVVAVLFIGSKKQLHEQVASVCPRAAYARKQALDAARKFREYTAREQRRAERHRMKYGKQ